MMFIHPVEVLLDEAGLLCKSPDDADAVDCFKEVVVDW